MFFRSKFVTKFRPSSHPSSFLREVGKLYILYMVAGVAAMPAGVLYAILRLKGYDGWLAAAGAIMLGLLIAKVAWSCVEWAVFTRYFVASGASTTWSLVPTTAIAVTSLMLSLPPTALPLTRQATRVDGLVTGLDSSERAGGQANDEPLVTWQAEAI
jgi:hypothetical protein